MINATNYVVASSYIFYLFWLCTWQESDHFRATAFHFKNYLFFLSNKTPTADNIADNVIITSFDAAVPVLVKTLSIVVLPELVALLLFVLTTLSSSLFSSIIVNLVKWFVSNSNLDDTKVKAFMELVKEKGVFTFKGGDIISLDSAQIVETKTFEIEL